MQMKFSTIRGLAIAAVLFGLLAGQAFAAGEVFHPAYLGGFPDGTIRPEAALTREQLAQALYRLIPENCRDGLDAPTCFSDVPPSRWSYAAVTAMVNLGVLYGTQNGTFSPETGVTGPELAAALMRVAASETAAGCLPELAESWSALEPSFSEGDGWIMGFDGAKFEPDRPLARAELAHILNRLLDRSPASLDALLVGMPLWTDNLDTEMWYFLDMQEAGTGHTACPDAGGEAWSALG